MTGALAVGVMISTPPRQINSRRSGDASSHPSGIGNTRRREVGETKVSHPPVVSASTLADHGIVLHTTQCTPAESRKSRIAMRGEHCKAKSANW